MNRTREFWRRTESDSEVSSTEFSVDTESVLFLYGNRIKSEAAEYTMDVFPVKFIIIYESEIEAMRLYLAFIYGFVLNIVGNRNGEGEG